MKAMWETIKQKKQKQRRIALLETIARKEYNVGFEFYKKGYDIGIKWFSDATKCLRYYSMAFHYLNQSWSLLAKLYSDDFNGFVNFDKDHFQKVMAVRTLEGHVCKRIGKPPKWKPWPKILCSICGARETTKKQRRHYE